VHLNRVNVSGFKRGIEVAASGTVGFRNVLIADATLHDNLEAGFASHGPEFSVDAAAYAHEDVVLRRVASYRNVGDSANTTRNTGSGAVLGSVRRGLVEQCRFFDNGASSTATQGPLGVWAYDSTGVVIQRNASYRNRTAATDGGGFGAVTVLGRMSSSDVYQNTVLLTASTARKRPPVVLDRRGGGAQREQMGPLATS
jgi:hypothetical protein